MTGIPVGLTFEREFRPERWHLAAAIGNTGVMAVSTPAVLGFLEQASLEAIQPYQAPEEVSVGAYVALDHVGPAFPGAPIRCGVSVDAVSGRRITFSVQAEQNGKAVARGTYIRVIISTKRFHAGGRLEHPSSPLSPIEFWFDVHSPWSYLAGLRLPAVAARHGRPVRWIPIHVARLIERIGGRRPLEENPAFVRWYRDDLMRWAERVGVPIRYHPEFPLRPARALRVATYAIEQDRGPAFVLALMRAYWSDNLDISNFRVLGSLAESVGLDRAASEQAAGSPEFRDKVEAATESAIAAGVFGVPTFRVDGALFFGNDRIEMLDEHLSDSDTTASVTTPATGGWRRAR